MTLSLGTPKRYESFFGVYQNYLTNEIKQSFTFVDRRYIPGYAEGLLGKDWVQFGFVLTQIVRVIPR